MSADGARPGEFDFAALNLSGKRTETMIAFLRDASP